MFSLKGEEICLLCKQITAVFGVGPAPSPLDIAREGIRVRRGPTATMLFYLFPEKITTGENCECLDYLALFAENKGKSGTVDLF